MQHFYSFNVNRKYKLNEISTFQKATKNTFLPISVYLGGGPNQCRHSRNEGEKGKLVPFVEDSQTG